MVIAGTAVLLLGVVFDVEPMKLGGVVLLGIGLLLLVLLYHGRPVGNRMWW